MDDDAMSDGAAESGRRRRPAAGRAEYPNLVYPIPAPGTSGHDGLAPNIGALIEQTMSTLVGYRPPTGSEGLRAALDASFEPIQVEGRTEWRLRRGRRGPQGAPAQRYGVPAVLHSTFACLIDEIKSDLARLAPLGCHVDAECEEIVGLKAHAHGALDAILEQLASPYGPIAAQIKQAIEVLCGDEDEFEDLVACTDVESPSGLIAQIARAFEIDPARATSLRHEESLTAMCGIVLRAQMIKDAWEKSEASAPSCWNNLLGLRLAPLAQRLAATASAMHDAQRVLSSVYLDEVDQQVVVVNGESMANVFDRLEGVVIHARTRIEGAEGRIAARVLRSELESIDRWIETASTADASTVPGAFRQPRVVTVLNDLRHHVRAAANILEL